MSKQCLRLLPSASTGVVVEMTDHDAPSGATVVYKCDGCGDEVREPDADGPWDCAVCDGRMKPHDEVEPQEVSNTSNDEATGHGVYKCDGCGDEVREPDADGPWEYVVCGGQMQPKEEA